MNKFYRYVLSSDSKIAMAILALLYSMCYRFIYEGFVVENFTYMIGEYTPPTQTNYMLYLLFSVIPILFYGGIKTIGSLLSIFVYIFIYIPTLFGSSSYHSSNEGIIFAIVLFLCISAFFLTDNISLRIFKSPAQKISFIKIEWITIICVCYLTLRFAGNLTFVNIFSNQDIMYDIRAGRNFDTITAYILPWTNNVFLPFCLVKNLIEKNKKKVILSYLGFFIMFLIDMQKMTFILPFVMLGLYWITKNSNMFLKTFHSFIMVILSVPSYLICVFMASTESIIFSVAAILIMRTQTVGTWLTFLYLDFFSSNPYTHYGHINIFNAIFNNYPYDMPLGVVIGDENMNANANFILTDGIAAMGLPGVFIVSFIFILFKMSLTYVGKDFNIKYCTIILMPVICAMLNVSLFTTLITYGFLLIYFIFYKVDLSFLKNN